MVNLVLGDIFQTHKGAFVVTGIQFTKGVTRLGVLIKPYRVANDPRHPATFVADETLEANRYEYKGNKLFGDV